VELGVISFAEIVPDPKTGSVLSPGQRVKDIIEEMRNTMGVPAAALPGPADYEADMALHGGLAAGTPEQVAEKIVYQHDLLRNDRFAMRISLGSMPHADVLRAIERFGTEVAPLVRSALP
jgi:alkanesulfonate monooxygenase SsuD/methylene tetrahydromethanopterin reductase-like flavin-dependent oxidoreductase (luciferase family)